MLFRPFENPDDAVHVPFFIRKLRHPVFSWLGLRPVFAQHTRDEHDALLRWAADKRSVVEIGVAEGASACALRESMSPNGTIFLIDPFHLSRMRHINALKRAAHAAVGRFGRSRVEWIDKFSYEAVQEWATPIDLLFLDGDHREEAVLQDWEDWSKFVVPAGIALFHDARVFEKGWPTDAYGPVRAVNKLFREGRADSWRIVGEVDSLVIVERLS
jgi:predicted O-methyltransferase YrrM